jgi:hypothetical protein
MKEISPLLPDDALNLLLLKRRQTSAIIPASLSSILLDLQDRPLAIILAASCVASMSLNSAATHLRMLQEEGTHSSGNLDPKIWQWFSNLMVELNPIELSLVCLLAMFDNVQLSDEFLDTIRFGFSSEDTIITNRQFRPSLQRLVSIQLLHRRSDSWTQYHHIRPAIQECLVHYLSLHENRARSVAEVGSFLLHAAFNNHEFQDLKTSKNFLMAIHPHCHAFCLSLQKYSISVPASLGAVLSRLSCYYIDEGISEILARCKTQFWRTWLFTNNFTLPEDYEGEDDHALYVEPAVVPTWVLEEGDSTSPTAATVDQQTYEPLYNIFWEDLSMCLSMAAIGQAWHGIREDIFRFARELPSAPRDDARIGEVTNSIDKGGCSGLQAAVMQAIYAEAFKTELMSNGGREAIKEISYVVSDSLSGSYGDIPSDTLGNIISNALGNFSWSGFFGFGPPFSRILQGTPKVAVCNVIEPAMGAGADPEGLERVTHFMMNTFAGEPLKDCSRRLARGYWEVVGGLTLLFAASILNQLNFDFFQQRGPSLVGEDDQTSQRYESDVLAARSLELLREAVMQLLSRQSPAWALSVKKTAYWCLQAEGCRNVWAHNSTHTYRNQEIWEESCIILEMKEDCWPLS